MKKIEVFVCLGLCLSLALPASATEPIDDNPAEAAATTTVATSELAELKKMLLDQQRQIDELRRQIAGDKSAPALASAPASNPASNPVKARPSLGEVASMAPIVPPTPAPAAAPAPKFNPTMAASPAAAPADESSPLQLKIGDAYITPVGFMDMTSVSRSTNAGSGIGTNFGEHSVREYASRKPDGNAAHRAELADRGAHRCDRERLECARLLGV